MQKIMKKEIKEVLGHKPKAVVRKREPAVIIPATPNIEKTTSQAWKPFYVISGVVVAILAVYLFFKSKQTEFMQYLFPVSVGPSLNM